MFKAKNYLSHTRVLLLSRAIARASAPASPILLPQSLGIQRKSSKWKCTTNKMFGILQEDVYPKYCSERFNFSPSASCFAPSAVTLLLPSLKENREVHLLFLLHHTDLNYYNSILVSHLTSAENTVCADLRERKSCLVLRR